MTSPSFYTSTPPHHNWKPQKTPTYKITNQKLNCPFICNDMLLQSCQQQTQWLQHTLGQTQARPLTRYSQGFQQSNELGKQCPNMSQLCPNKCICLDTTKQLLRTETPVSTVYALHKLAGKEPRRDKRAALAPSSRKEDSEDYAHQNQRSRSLYSR